MNYLLDEMAELVLADGHASLCLDRTTPQEIRYVSNQLQKGIQALTEREVFVLQEPLDDASVKLRVSCL